MLVAGFALGLAALLSLLITKGLINWAPAGLLDYPNARSLHTYPIPRGGGLGIIAGVLVGWGIFIQNHKPDQNLSVLLPIALILALISFVDDVRSLSPWSRLLVQASLSALLIAFGYWLPQLDLLDWQWRWPMIIGVSFSWLWLIWMTNLYNFMDGMDGLAAGMAVFGFGTLSWLGYRSGALDFAFLCALIAIASLGFLYFNLPPARIFLGDVGSTFLGFIAGSLILWGANQHIFPFWLGILPFGPFVVDATITLVRRLFHRERIWVAHRSHYYQRLVQTGWGHAKTLMIEYLLMAATSGLTILLFTYPQLRRVGLGSVIFIYTALVLWVERYLRQQAQLV